MSRKTHAILTKKLEDMEKESRSIAAKLNMKDHLYPDFSHLKRRLNDITIRNKSNVKRLLRVHTMDGSADLFVQNYADLGGYGKGTQDDHSATTKLGRMLNVLLGYEANYLEKDGAAVAMSRLYDRKRKEN